MGSDQGLHVVSEPQTGCPRSQSAKYRRHLTARPEDQIPGLPPMSDQEWEGLWTRSPSDLAGYQHIHRVPPEQLVAYAAGCSLYAWVFAEPTRFQYPVPYRHPSGAVIWVRLSF